MAKFRSIVCISDQHFPYNHPDVIAFLRAIEKKYRPDKIVNIGDETDGHAISFHEHSPDLMSPSDELQTAINRMKPLYELWPEMDLVESNHGSLVYRRGSHAGLPRYVLKPYGDVLEAPKTWTWHKDLTLQASDGSHIYFCHGRASDGMKLSQSMGMSTVQGHFHEKFEIRYWGNSIGLYWSMIIGCLIDNDSLAFAYNKLNLKRPIIGTGVILNGQPKLVPMIMKPGGRWIGELPP